MARWYSIIRARSLLCAAAAAAIVVSMAPAALAQPAADGQAQCRGAKKWYAGACHYPEDIAAMEAEKARRAAEAARQAAEQAREQAEAERQAEERERRRADAQRQAEAQRQSEPATTSGTAAPTDEGSTSPIAIAGLVVGGVGVAALGVGIAMGAVVLAEEDELLADCPEQTGCAEEVLSERDAILTKADVSTIAIIGGSAAITAGLLMFLLAPDPDEPPSHSATARLLPHVGPSSAGIEVRGAF
jgi:hypothetical protein